jgi:uncharacterized membrane protein
MAGTFIGIEILSKKYAFKKVVSLTIVILFFSMIFFWYSQVTETAFNAGVSFVEETLSNLNRFFVEESRGGPAQALLGKGIMEKGIPHKIQFVFTWLTFVFIGIGVITLIRRYKEMSFPELKLKKPDFLKDKFEVGYFVLALACSGLLAAVVAVPYITVGYGLDRMYPLAITILSVFFVIGGIILSKHFFFFKKRKPVLKEKNNCFFSKGRSEGENSSQVWAYLIILLVLIPHFLSVTGVTYQMFGYPRAITLNSEGEQYDMMYMHDQESYGAKWLGNYGEIEDTKVYTGGGGGTMLLSQAGIRNYDIWAFFVEGRKIEGYIYLRYYNVVNGKILGGQGAQKGEHNMTEYQDKFVDKNRIYNNGGSEVWR